jgi:hypothetical protein
MKWATHFNVNFRINLKKTPFVADNLIFIII